MIPGKDEVMNGKRRNWRTGRQKNCLRDLQMCEQRKKKEKQMKMCVTRHVKQKEKNPSHTQFFLLTKKKKKGKKKKEKPIKR